MLVSWLHLIQLTYSQIMRVQYRTHKYKNTSVMFLTRVEGWNYCFARACFCCNVLF